MPIRIVRGKDCDINDSIQSHLSSCDVRKCLHNADEYIQKTHLKYWMDCFSLKRVDSVRSGVTKVFYWHDCECGLPAIVCSASFSSKHRDVNDQKPLNKHFLKFFKEAESYICENVLPKEGEAKSPWIEFSILLTFYGQRARLSAP